MATCTAVRLSACTTAAATQDARRPVSAMRAPVAARSIQQKDSVAMGGSAAVQAFGASMTPATGRAERMVVLARQGGGRRGRRDQEDDGFEERVVQVRRVTKVVKGGKQLSFRAVVVVGDRKGKVGVGCAAAKEVVQAVQKAAVTARAECVSVPITRGETFPHRVEGRHGAAKVMMRPAAEGCGVIAGGATRVVMELAGIRNGFGKQLGTDNPLNNARAAVEGLSRLRTWKQVSDSRGLPVSVLMNIQKDEATA